MKPNRIVAFAGRIGAGKSSISHALASDLGWKFASFGALVRKIASNRGLDLSRESLQAVGEELEAKDAKAFCRAVLNDAEWNPGEPLVLDGIRHVRILETLRNLVAPQPLGLVYLEADDELRRSRLQQRGAEEVNHLEAVEAHSTESDVVARLPRLANLVVSSATGSESELVQRIKEEFGLGIRG